MTHSSKKRTHIDNYVAYLEININEKNLIKNDR